MHTGIQRAKSTVQQVQFEEREYKEFYNRDEKTLAFFFFSKTYSETVLYVFAGFSEDNHKIITFSPPEAPQIGRITSIDHVSSFLPNFKEDIDRLNYFIFLIHFPIYIFFLSLKLILPPSYPHNTVCKFS